jgi:hypothetical protein
MITSAAISIMHMMMRRPMWFIAGRAISDDDYDVLVVDRAQ